MTIPAPPADNSGGYAVISYTNGTDTHRMRVHMRPFDTFGTFAPAPPGPSLTVMAEFTAFMAKVAPITLAVWTFSLTSIFRNNGDGTFTEIFGWVAPAPVAGALGGAPGADQSRAQEDIWNFRSGFGGRARVIFIAQHNAVVTLAPATIAGAPAGTAGQQFVDYLTNQAPVKSNIVCHDGHPLQNPAHLTYCVNRRLRRHYGYA